MPEHTTLLGKLAAMVVKGIKDELSVTMELSVYQM